MYHINFICTRNGKECLSQECKMSKRLNCDDRKEVDVPLSKEEIAQLNID